MLGLKFMDEVPFREVYVHGLIRDSEGQKMSKSKGNVLDPLDLIDGIGARGADRQAHRRPDAAAPRQAASRRATRKQFPDGIAAVRHRRAALHFRLAGDAVARHPLRRRPHRGLPQLLQQAVERRALRADERRGPGPRARRGAAVARRPLDPLAARGGARGDARRLRRLPLRPREPGAVRVHLVRVLRLVPRAQQGRAAVGRLDRRGAARDAPHAGRHARGAAARAAPADAVHHRGDLAARRAARRPRRRRRSCTQPWPVADAAARDAAVEAEMRWVMDFILGVRQIRGEMDIAPSRRFDVLLGHASAADLRAPGARPALARAARQPRRARRARRRRGGARVGGRAARRAQDPGADGGPDRRRRRGRAPRQAHRQAPPGPRQDRGQARQRRASSPTPRPPSSSRSARASPSSDASSPSSSRSWRACADSGAAHERRGRHAPRLRAGHRGSSTASCSARTARCGSRSPACWRAATC